MHCELLILSQREKSERGIYRVSGKVRGMQGTKKERLDKLTAQMSRPSTLNPQLGKEDNGGKLTLLVAERPIRAALYE
jgi:hypothetical protein